MASLPAAHAPTAKLRPKVPDGVDRFLKIGQVAEIFGCSKLTIRNRIKRGELPPLRRAGAHVGYLMSEVNAALAATSQRAA